MTIEFQTLGDASKRVVVKRAALREPITISEFWVNRRGEAVKVSLRNYEGIALVDVRRHYTGKDGKLWPTKKGLSIVVRKLPDLHAAIAKALAKARELGLVKTEGEQ